MGIIQTTMIGPGIRAKLSWISLVSLLWNQDQELDWNICGIVPPWDEKHKKSLQQEGRKSLQQVQKKAEIKGFWGSDSSKFLSSISDLKFYKVLPQHLLNKSFF